MNAFSRVAPISRLALCVSVGLLALTICARQSPAQGKRGVDPALAKRGGQLFQSRGCFVCHTVGKTGEHTAEGPDLAGVTDRRTNDWLVSWLKNPSSMFGSDAAADAMLKQYHEVKMPNMHLGESDVTAIITYLSQYHQR